MLTKTSFCGRDEVTIEAEDRGEVTTEAEDCGEVTVEAEDCSEVMVEAEDRGEVMVGGLLLFFLEIIDHLAGCVVGLAGVLYGDDSGEILGIGSQSPSELDGDRPLCKVIICSAADTVALSQILSVFCV